MSQYSTQIRFICETEVGYDTSQGYMSVNEILEKSASKVFNFPFPLFDEAYRQPLISKILKHYYTREIGFETVGLFKLKLDTKMNEIMPYYNQLYKSALLDFNPFYDVDLTRTHTMKNEGKQDVTGNIKSNDTINVTDSQTKSVDSESDTTSDTSGNNTLTTVQTGTNTNDKKDLLSETPQGGIVGLENGDYLSEGRIINETDNVNQTATSDGTTGDHSEQSTTSSDRSNSDRDMLTKTNLNQDNTSTTNINNLEDYIENVKGKQGSGSYSTLLKEFRETFLNIDMLIIVELTDLFFNLWD